MALNFTGERFVPGMEGVIEAEHLHRYLLARELATGRDVLDVACGEGYGSNLLAGVAHSVVGVDIADSAVDHACEKYAKPNLRFVQGDCAKLPSDDASVDLVVSFETIEHHERHSEMMIEIRRVLRRGGVLMISSPNRPEYDKTLTEPNPYHVKELDFVEFVALLEQHFKNVVIYAQRVLSGSLLVPCEHSEGCFSNFSNAEANQPSMGLERPIYFVALAGDADLPVLGVSVYETGVHGKANAVAEAAFLEARVYLSERVDGVAQAYGERRGDAMVYPLDGVAKTIDLTFPGDLQPLARLRLDIANSHAAIALHALSLHNADGEELWRWDGGCDAFVSPGDVVCIPGERGATLLCLNDDPQFDLAVPSDILESVRGSAFLRLEMTPKPLLDELPGVMARIQTGPKAALPALAGAHLPAGLAGHLEELAGLLKMQVTRKNSTIAAQQTEIESLRERQQLLYEQVVRAEAQLDLLKEFALPEAGNRLERL